MSLRNKIVFAFVLALPLSGCGFHPVYGKKGITDDKTQLLAGITIDTIAGREGQELKSELEDRLNPKGDVPVAPVYHLKADFSHSVVPIGVARDGTVSRYNIYLTSHYSLYRNSDGAKILTGDVNYVDSYNNLTNAYFSTYISEGDAMKRGITELAELYKQRLAVDIGSATNPLKP